MKPIISSGADGEVDCFTISPEATSPLIFKYASNVSKPEMVRFTGLASFFNNRELLDQTMLRLIWRVRLASTSSLNLQNMVSSVQLSRSYANEDQVPRRRVLEYVPLHFVFHG